MPTCYYPPGGIKESFTPLAQRGLSDLVQEIPDGFFNKLDRGMEPLTWKVLAKELEVSHQGLHLWRQLEDAPATADLEAWKAFKAERCLGRVRATGELN